MIQIYIIIGVATLALAFLARHAVDARASKSRSDLMRMLSKKLRPEQQAAAEGEEAQGERDDESAAAAVAQAAGSVLDLLTELLPTERSNKIKQLRLKAVSGMSSLGKLKKQGEVGLNTLSASVETRWEQGQMEQADRVVSRTLGGLKDAEMRAIYVCLVYIVGWCVVLVLPDQLCHLTLVAPLCALALGAHAMLRVANAWNSLEPTEEDENSNTGRLLKMLGSQEDTGLPKTVSDLAWSDKRTAPALKHVMLLAILPTLLPLSVPLTLGTPLVTLSLSLTQQGVALRGLFFLAFGAALVVDAKLSKQQQSENVVEVVE